MTNEIEKEEKAMKTKQPTFFRSNATDTFVYETQIFLSLSFLPWVKNRLAAFGEMNRVLINRVALEIQFQFYNIRIRGNLFSRTKTMRDENSILFCFLCLKIDEAASFHSSFRAIMIVRLKSWEKREIRMF